MTVPQIAETLKQAGQLLATVRLADALEEALSPRDRDTLRDVQRELSQVRRRMLLNPFR